MSALNVMTGYLYLKIYFIKCRKPMGSALDNSWDLHMHLSIPLFLFASSYYIKVRKCHPLGKEEKSGDH